MLNFLNFDTSIFQTKKDENESKLRTVSIPNTRDDPGFQVDVRINKDGEQEVFVAERTVRRRAHSFKVTLNK